MDHPIWQLAPYIFAILFVCFLAEAVNNYRKRDKAMTFLDLFMAFWFGLTLIQMLLR